MINTTIKPESPLPWRLPCTEPLLDYILHSGDTKQYGNAVATELYEKDATYIVEAANNYPKLLKLYELLINNRNLILNYMKERMSRYAKDQDKLENESYITNIDCNWTRDFTMDQEDMEHHNYELGQIRLIDELLGMYDD